MKNLAIITGLIRFYSDESYSGLLLWAHLYSDSSHVAARYKLSFYYLLLIPRTFRSAAAPNCQRSEYRVAQKVAHLFVRRVTSSNIDRLFSNFLQTFFIGRIKRKFVIILALKIPSHLKRVAALSCEMSVF